MQKTQVINLFGGPGVGKSTTAAGLYYFMKLKKFKVELVREYVKMWAWENRHVSAIDQIYITGKQAKYEYSLYNKVDFIITDSPMLLGPVYEKVYSGPEIVKESVFNFIDSTKEIVQHHNIVLSRHKNYDPHGRYQSEDEAKEVDTKIKNFLDDYKIAYTVCNEEDSQRVEWIFNYLGLLFL